MAGGSPFFLAVPKHSEPLRDFACLLARVWCLVSVRAISHASSDRRWRLGLRPRAILNGTPAPGLAASASIAPLGVCIYAVGGESCRIRARPEAVRSAGGGEIARAWHVLALGSPVFALIPPYGRKRSTSRAIRRRSASRGFVAEYRSSPRSRLGASDANRSPAAALRSVFGLAFRPRPRHRWRLPVRRLCALPTPSEPLSSLASGESS